MTLPLFVLVHRGTPVPVAPFDCNPNAVDQGVLCYRSQEAGDAAAEHQNKLYELDCECISWDEFVKRQPRSN